LEHLAETNGQARERGGAKTESVMTKAKPAPDGALNCEGLQSLFLGLLRLGFRLGGCLLGAQFTSTGKPQEGDDISNRVCLLNTSII
jgi:hypothetical protein